MKTHRKFFAVLIAMVMLLTTALPLSAFAGEGDDLIDFGSASAETVAAGNDNAENADEEVGNGQEEASSAGSGSVEFVEDVPEVQASTNNATEQSGQEQEASSPSVNEKSAETEAEEEKASDTSANTNNAPAEQVQANPVVTETDNAETPASQETPAQNEDATPPVPDVEPEETITDETPSKNDKEPEINLDDALTDASVKDPDKATVESGSNIQANAHFITTRQLDKVFVTIRFSNTELATLKIASIENAGNATYKVLKPFHIKYTDEDEKTHEKDVKAVCAEGAVSESGTVHLDLEYRETKGAEYPEAEATFLGEYYLIFENVPESFASTLNIKGSVIENENATISVIGSAFVGEKYKDFSLGKATYKYEEKVEEKPEEENPDKTEKSDVTDGDVNEEKSEDKTDEQSGEKAQTRSAAPATRGLTKGGSGDDTQTYETTAGAYYTESSSYGHISSTPLSGVAITLTAADGSMDAVTKTTDESGLVSFGELPAGEYTATVKGWDPDVYTLNGNESDTHANNIGQSDVGGNMTATFMFGFTCNRVEENNSSIVIFVKDNTNSTEENPVGVSGATGKIVKGDEEKSFATGSDGKAKIENLSSGTWSVYLLTTPDEYKDPDATNPVTEINLDENTEFTCTIPVNTKPTTGTLTFEAYDTDDHDVKLAGVAGTIKNGDLEQTFVTDADGTASLTRLSFGTWDLYLTETPEGYTDPDENQKLGSLELSVDTPVIGPVSLSVKKAATSGKLTVMAVLANSEDEGIAGIAYELSNEEGVIDTQTTNADGYAYFDNLPYGVTYTIKEHTIPEDYEESERDPQQIDVTLTAPQQVKFGYHVKDHDEPTPGTETATVNVTAVEKDTETPVSGVVLELVSDEAAVEKTTGEDGKTSWSEVAPGTYFVRSKTIPAAYKQVEYTSDTFTLEAGTIMNVNTIVLTPVEDEPVNPTTGSILVNVVFADGDVVTPVASADIQINREDLDEPYTGTTDENGQYNLEDIPVGTYTVSVTGMPAEYEETYDDQEAVVTEEEAATVTFTAVKKQAEEKKTGTVKITVTANDADSTPVEGATICIEKDDESVWTGTTMADGTVVSDSLETGAYLVRIDSLPDGYTNETEPLSVTVEEDDEAGASFIVGVAEPMRTLTICLKDKDTGDGVEGVVLSLREAGEDVAQKETDANGEVSFSVPAGQYTLEIDMDTIPDGYSDPEYDGVYDLNGDDPVTDTIELTGSFGTVSFSATNKTTGEPVSGVVFCVSNEEWDSDKEYTTGNDGTASARLAAGMYTVSLAGVPSAYEELDFVKEIELVAGETSENAIALYSKDTPEDGKITIQAVNAETGDPVEGVAFIVKSDDPDDEGTEYVAIDDGLVTIVKEPGTYTVTLSDMPAGFEQATFEKTYNVERGILIEDTVRLTPKTDVEPETLEILEFTGLSFNPEEQSIVPTSDYTIALEGYALKLNKASATADQVKFEIKPVTPDMRMVATFTGTASGYKVVAIHPVGDSGVAETVTSVSASGSGVCAVSFDSKNIPMKNPETGEIDPEIEGAFPEGTESVRIYVYNPSADFAVNEFTLSGTTDSAFDKVEFVATTEVTVGTLPKQTEENTGKITKGNPEGTLTITGTASRLNTGDDMGYNVAFKNESNTVYASVTLDVCVDDIFIPEKLNPGVWNGYEGNLEVFTVGTNGQATSLCVIDASTTNTILLTKEPIKAIRFVTKAEVAGSIGVDGITLSGTFNEGGTAKAHAELVGNISDDLVWNMSSDEISTEVIEVPEPVQTGTITITVRDNNNNAVSGVKFTIGDAEVETGETGIATIEVNAGTYNAALTYVPDTYEAVEYSKAFDVTGGSALTDVVVLTVKPVVTPIPKGTLEVTVIEETTGTEQIPVAGVEVSLYKRTDESESVRVGTGTTNENGIITDTLEEGAYIIKVASVPDAYEASAYEKEVTVTAATPVKEVIVLKKTSVPTPTPTPTPPPDSGDDPVPPGPGGNTGGNPTPTPTPEPDPLSVDSPKITANTSSVAYGEDALFYVRGLSAGGMDPTDYYVLHLMIPSGIQVKTLTFPGFGTDTRVTLTYDSGTTELGTYSTGETVNLTERQGTNLRYIAFQIHGVDKVTPDGDVQLLVKNISARDRIVTLQAILSIRDSKTAVKTLDNGKKAQNSDRYNISISGPKDNNTNDNNTNSNGNAGNTTGEKGNEPQKPVTIEDRVTTVYPQLVYVDPEEKADVKIFDVEKKDPAPKPLILQDKNETVEVLSIATTAIADQPVTDELILARMKQKALALTRLFHERNKQTVNSIIK